MVPCRVAVQADNPEVGDSDIHQISTVSVQAILQYNIATSMIHLDPITFSAFVESWFQHVE